VPHRLDSFETRQVKTVPLDIEIPPYTATSARAFVRSVESRILQVPGVQSLAWESIAPFNGAPISEIRLDSQSKGQGRPASVDNVSADFFSTFGIPLMYGRAFLHSDVPATGSAQLAVVSQAFAKTFWGNNSPVGKVANQVLSASNVKRRFIRLQGKVAVVTGRRNGNWTGYRRRVCPSRRGGRRGSLHPLHGGMLAIPASIRFPVF
jgi:hypothetical protein